MRSQKRIKRDSRREEAMTAKALGGRLTFNSGTDLEKGDGRVFGLYRIENKITDSESYRLTGEEFEFLWRTAMMSGEHAVFAIRLPVPGASVRTRLVAIDRTLAETLGLEITAAPVNRNGELGAKGYALSTKTWLRLGEKQGYLYLVLRAHAGNRKQIVVMRWERFRDLNPHKGWA